MQLCASDCLQLCALIERSFRHVTWPDTESCHKSLVAPEFVWQTQRAPNLLHEAQFSSPRLLPWCQISASHPDANVLPAMDAIDIIILTESDAAAAAGAAQSIAQLYSLVGAFKDRRGAFDRLYAELGALRDILETLRMSLDNSSSRVTKDQQQLPKESRRLLEACKIVCDKFYADFSDVMRHSTPSDRMRYNSKLQRKAGAASDAAAKLHIWKMNLGLVAEVMQL